MISIREATEADVDQCVDILSELPDHFPPDTRDHVRTAFAERHTWVAVDGAAVVGFVQVEQRRPTTAEIMCAAVRSELRGNGIGTAMVDAVLSGLRADGVALVEVKTLDASAGYEPYQASRAFWTRRGFHQIDTVDLVGGWQAGNPSAIYVAALRATH